MLLHPTCSASDSSSKIEWHQSCTCLRTMFFHGFRHGTMAWHSMVSRQLRAAIRNLTDLEGSCIIFLMTLHAWLQLCMSTLFHLTPGSTKQSFFPEKESTKTSVSWYKICVILMYCTLIYIYIFLNYLYCLMNIYL